MIEKIMRIFCFVVAFVLITSNVKVFSQEVHPTKAISSSEMAELEKGFTEVREMLLSFREYFSQKLSGFKIKGGEYFNGYLFWENIGSAQEKAAKLDKAYITLLDKTYSYTDYILDEEGNTALNRLTYKYLGTPGVKIQSYHLQEGTIFEKIYGILNGLEKTWFEAPSYKKIFTEAKKQESVINDLVNALDTRLTEVRGVFDRSVERNNAIYVDNMQEIFEKHITQDDVLSAALKRIPEEERKAIKLYLKVKNLKESNISIASGIREYLIFMGKKDVPSVFKLVKSGVLHSLEMEEFKQTVNKKWKNVIDDFPIFKNGRYIPPEYTMRRLLRAAPIMAVGAVLSAGAILEIRSSNNFNEGSRGARMISEIKKKIDKGEASFAETVLYYSDERSSESVNQNPESLIDAINLALAVKQANEDFDIISRSIQTEVGKKYVTVSEEEIENSFNIFYDKAIQRVEDGLI